MSTKSKVIALSLGSGLTSLVVVLSAAVLSRILSKADYATFRQVFLAYSFVFPLLMMGLTKAVFYYLPAEKERVRGRIMDVLCVLGVMGGAFALFVLFGGSEFLARRFNNPDLAAAMRIVAPYPLFVLPAAVLSSVLVSFGRVTTLSVFNVLSKALIGAAIILPCLIWRNVTAPIVGELCAVGLSFVVAVYLMFRFAPHDDWRPRWGSAWEMLRFSIPLGLSAMAGTMSMQLDKIIVSSLCSPEDFAIYSNGAFEIPLIGIVTGSIATVILAEMRKKVVDGDYEGTVRLFRIVAEKSAWILLPAMIFLFINAELVIPLLFSQKYSGSVLPFQLYLLMLPARIVTFGSLLIAAGLVKQMFVRDIGCLVLNAILSWAFVSWFGYIGAAISSIIIIYVWAIPVSLTCAAHHFNMRGVCFIPFGGIFKIFMVSLLPAVLVLGCDAFWGMGSPILKLGLNFVIFGGVMLWLWNGKIYSMRSLVERLGLRLRPS